MRLLGFFLLIAGLMLGSWLLWGGDLEERFTLEGAVSWLDGTGGWAWAAGIGLLVADVLIPVPGTVVMSALGWVYGPLVGGLMALAGSTAAGLAAYGVGRIFGENLARRLLGSADFTRWHAIAEERGGLPVALSRALPVLAETVAVTAGLVRMPFGRFFRALVCGTLPVSLLFAGIGAAGKSEPAWAFAFSLVVPALLWGLSRVADRRLKFERPGDG